MMKMKRIMSLIAALLMVLALAACASDEGKPNDGSSQGSIVSNAKADEKDFEWDGDIITGLTGSGELKSTLVIPERCQGFEGPLFPMGTEPIDTVIFEGDHDIDISGLFTYVENLRAVKLPAGLTVIPKDAFCGCAALEELEVPAAVEEIGEDAFRFCYGLRRVTFEGNAITTISEGAFDSCIVLEEIIFADSIREIGDRAFASCFELKSVTLPEGIKSMGEHAFASNGLEDVYIPKDVVIEDMGFAVFVQSNKMVTIHLAEGSWVDQNFEELFDYSVNKVYD